MVEYCISISKIAGFLTDRQYSLQIWRGFPILNKQIQHTMMLLLEYLMRYRQFKRTGLKISEISLGTEHIESAPYDEIKRIVDFAMDNGVNYTDLVIGSPGIGDHFGKALEGKRDKIMIAGHLGSTWKDKQYYRTRDMKMIKTFFYDLLERLDTDYIDMLILHYIDEMDDWEVCLKDGMFDFALKLKNKGIIRMIGVSTHVPKVAYAAINTGEIDGIMYSTNPMYDLMSSDKGIDKPYTDNETLKGVVSIQYIVVSKLYELEHSLSIMLRK